MEEGQREGAEQRARIERGRSDAMERCREEEETVAASGLEKHARGRQNGDAGGRARRAACAHGSRLQGCGGCRAATRSQINLSCAQSSDVSAGALMCTPHSFDRESISKSRWRFLAVFTRCYNRFRRHLRLPLWASTFADAFVRLELGRGVQSTSVRTEMDEHCIYGLCEQRRPGG